MGSSLSVWGKGVNRVNRVARMSSLEDCSGFPKSGLKSMLDCCGGVRMGVDMG